MSFKDALHSKDFVVSAELPLTPATTKESLLADAELLGDSVDGFLLTDNQYGQPHMAPLAAAAILQNNDFAPILQISCRNRNRIALLGEILGARALGVDSLLIVRGGVLPEGYKPRPTAVQDTGAKDLIATAKMVQDDDRLSETTGFLLGATATVHDPASGWQSEALLAKADAGAQMIISQVCLDAGMVRNYMESLVAQNIVRRMSAIISIAVVESADLAQWLLGNRHGTVVPGDLIERRRDSTEPASEAIRDCATLVRDLAEIPGVSGVNFAVCGDLATIPSVVEASAIRN